MKPSRRTPVLSARETSEPPGRLLGYARVSTEDQSLALQTDALKRAGVAEADIVTEKLSGVSKRRAAFEAMLLRAAPGDTVVVWKLDRFGRSVLDIFEKLHWMQERGIRFRSLSEGIDTTTAIGRLLLTLLAGVAEFERALIQERTSAGIRAKQEKGAKFGRDRKLTAEKIMEMRRVYAAGGKTNTQIARQFGVHHKSVYNWCVRWAGIAPDPKDDPTT